MRINIYELEMKKVKGINVKLENAFVRSPGDAYKVVIDALNLSNQASEHFGIICLNTKNKVVGVHMISKGSLNSTIVHPREVFKAAIINNSSSIICYHNHPSGDPTPSSHDIEVTKKLKECGSLLGVDVLDHIIVGENCFVSLNEEGMM